MKSPLFLFLLLISVTLISAVITKTSWQVIKHDGLESDLDISRLNDKEICFNAKDNKKTFTNLNVYEGKEKKFKESRDISKLEKKNLIDFNNKECFQLDKKKEQYQFGDDSIIISLTNSYSITPDLNAERQCRIEGNESFLWSNCEVNKTHMDITPVSPTLDDVIVQSCLEFFPNETCQTFGENVTYEYPNFFTHYVGKNKEQQANIPLNVGTLTAGKFRRTLDPDIHYYQFGDNSIIISPTVTYDSTDVNVTQENKFSHLNISDGSLVFYNPFDIGIGGNWGEGIFGNGYVFDGTDDEIVIPDSSSLDSVASSNEITVSGWVNGDATCSGDSQDIFTKANSFALRFKLNSAGGCFSRFFIYDGGYQNVESDGVPSNGVWHHYVGTYNGSVIALYIDGVLNQTASYSGTIDNSINPAKIGNLDGATTFLDGRVDEVFIFNRTLNSTEVEELNNTFKINNKTGLISHWALNESFGVTAIDSQGSNTGTTIPHTTYDYTNSSNDGTVNGATFNLTGGYYGGAYEFDGVNDSEISLGDKSTLEGFSEFTLSAWIYPKSVQSIGHQSIIFKGDEISVPSSTRAYGIKIRELSSGTGECTNSFSDADIRVEIYTSTQLYVVCWGNISEQLNSWHLFQGTWNGTDLVLYWDGVEQARESGITGTLVNNAKAVNIGKGISIEQGQLTPESFNGTIDEVMIFNRSLSQTEIEQIYNSTFKRFMNPGTQNFTGLNFGTNNTVNISIPNAQQLNGSNLSFSINGGDFVDLNSSGMFDEYSLTGDLTDAFLTIQFDTGNENFYSSILAGNITLDDYTSGGTPAPTPSPFQGSLSCFGYNTLTPPSSSNCTRSST